MSTSELTTEQVALGVNELATKIGQDIKALKEGKLGISDNAVSASKWQNEITVTYFGAVTGSTTFDGSGNVSTELTFVDSGVTADTYSSNIQIPAITVNAKGLITSVTMNDIRSSNLTQTGVVQLSNDIYAADTEDDKAATIGSVSKVRGLMYGVLRKAGAGINLLSSYVKAFGGVGVDFTVSDVAASVSSLGGLKHIRGNVLTLETTNASNPDAYIFFDETTETYDNIQLESGVQYIYSFHAAAEVSGKSMRCAVRLSDGSFAVTDPHPLVLTDQVTRYSLSFIMPAGETGAVLAFYPNYDGELGTKFFIQGLMLERVVSTVAGNYVPSEYAA